jgi:hypothetical protein
MTTSHHVATSPPVSTSTAYSILGNQDWFDTSDIVHINEKSSGPIVPSFTPIAACFAATPAVGTAQVCGHRCDWADGNHLNDWLGTIFTLGCESASVPYFGGGRTPKPRYVRWRTTATLAFANTIRWGLPSTGWMAWATGVGSAPCASPVLKQEEMKAKASGDRVLDAAI